MPSIDEDKAITSAVKGDPNAHPLTPAQLKAMVANMLLRIHHAAIICSDYEQSKRFYSETLGLTDLAEHYRAGRASSKLDLALPDGSQIELFSFPDSPPRPSFPEARGLRHLAFEVEDQCKRALEADRVAVEAMRTQ